MDSQFYIGCSGYYYPNWKGKFYPNEIKPSQWLQYYSSIFNTVELNGTFYRLPKIADLKKYYVITGAHFRFSVKMSRYVTHTLRLKNCEQPIRDFCGLVKEGLADKFDSVLYQMPPSFMYTPENLNTIVEEVPSGENIIVELRHQSWWNHEVYTAFRQKGITFCNIDYPGFTTPFIATTSKFYLRLHGKPELFKSSYTIEQLNEFYKQIPQNCVQRNIYFNNTYYDAGYTNALQLKQLVKLNF